MKRTPVIYVYGISDTGKTRLVERLLLMLIQKGKRAGTVKMSKSEQLDFDIEGKDTQRHINAGSMVTAASNAAVFIPKALDVHRLIEMMSVTGDLDLVIVEGMGDDVPDTAPKVAVGEVKGRVPGTIMELPDADGELGGLYHLVDRIMTKSETVGEEDQVVLRVGGDDVTLKPFVRNYLEGTIRGAVGSLRDPGEPGAAIEISIPERKEPEDEVVPPRSLDID
jgi:molybdopterin-guanine dinucleotide biosynthesis protein MobB